MTRARFIACLLLVLTGLAVAQSSYNLEVGKSLAVDVPGATATYSLVTSVAEAALANGSVRLTGNSVGSTTVVVVTPGGVKMLAVTVSNPAAAAASRKVVNSESGNYSILYSSDPQQVTNTLDYTRRSGDSFQRLQVSDIAYFNGTSNFTTLPVLSLQLHTKEWDATLLDQRVDNSALTAQQVMVRGLHLQWRDWTLHAGFGSMVAYQNALLATDPEYVYGLTRRFRLAENMSLSANAYYFKNPASTLSVSSNGPLGSCVYEYRPGRTRAVRAEVAFSRVPGMAVSGFAGDVQQHVSGSLRVLPNKLPSMSLNSQHGVFGDVQYSRSFLGDYAALLSANLTNFDSTLLKERTFSVNGSLSRKLGERFTVSGGAMYSQFTLPSQATAQYQSLNLPLGLSYHSKQFSAGGQYTPTSDLAGHNSSGYELFAGAPYKHMQFNVSYRHDTQVPTVTSILAAVPELQDLLLRAGILTASLDDLIALLNNSAELNALGFSNLIGLSLTTTRDDVSAEANWISSGRAQQRVSGSFYDSRSRMPLTQLHFRSESVVYSRKLRGQDEVTAAVSLYQSDMAGGSGVHPAVQVSYRHPLRSLPIPLLVKHHGTINGHVFFDEEQKSRYSPALKGVAKAEVWLDGERQVWTDARGYYAFTGVAYGEHKVEVKYASAEPFFYTTDSPVVVASPAVADFGVKFVQGQLFGLLHDDTGIGIGGVFVELKSEGRSLRAVTGGDGSFQFRGLAAGKYTLAPDAATFPTGYDLQDVEERTYDVVPGRPVKVEYIVRAMRSISGLVTVYDPVAGKAIAVAGALVRLEGTAIQAKSDATGHYILRRVPPGHLKVTVEREGVSRSRDVDVPQRPGQLRNIDITVQ